MKQTPTNTQLKPLDAYTARLLQIQQALVKKEAFSTKKDFAETLLITGSFWNNIEARTDNYPQDLNKRHRAEQNLLSKYGVNPDYLKERSEKMFLKEPPKIETKKAITIDLASINLRDKKVKRSLLEQLEEERQKRIAAESQLATLQEELGEYKTKQKGITGKAQKQIEGPNPDNNPDK